MIGSQRLHALVVLLDARFAATNLLPLTRHRFGRQNPGAGGPRKILDDFERADSRYHGHGWESMSPGYWKLEDEALICFKFRHVPWNHQSLFDH